MLKTSYRINYYKGLALCILVLSIASCSTTSKKPGLGGESDKVEGEGGSEVIMEEERVIIVPPPVRKKTVSSPVIRALLIKSKSKFDKHDFESAAGYIERGIHISPNDPVLWQRLSVIRFEQGELKQAKQLAKKSNILVENDRTLRRINDDMINLVNSLLTP